MRRTGVRISLCWNFIIHQILPEFLQPLQDLRIQRVAQFYRGLAFYLFLHDYWLGFYQVALIYHQPKLTLALERCHSQFHPLFLKSEFHSLYVTKTSFKKMMSNDSLVLKVSLKLMKIQRTHLTSLEPQLERSSPCCKLSESRFKMICGF